MQTEDAHAQARAIAETANRRIASAEIRAAAAGRLADPDDALAYIDASSFTVSDDGNVDGAAVRAALDELVSRKPYLAADRGRFQGGTDGGARASDGNSLSQLTRSDMERMTPEQIVEARQNGRFARLLSGE